MTLKTSNTDEDTTETSANESRANLTPVSHHTVSYFTDAGNLSD